MRNIKHQGYKIVLLNVKLDYVLSNFGVFQNQINIRSDSAFESAKSNEGSIS